MVVAPSSPTNPPGSELCQRRFEKKLGKTDEDSLTLHYRNDREAGIFPIRTLTADAHSSKQMK
jgi:hypothetical protein